MSIQEEVARLKAENEQLKAKVQKHAEKQAAGVKWEFSDGFTDKQGKYIAAPMVTFYGNHRPKNLGIGFLLEILPRANEIMQDVKAYVASKA